MNQDLERLLGLAADVPPHRREDFLERECPDPAVRGEVAEFLRYADDAETFFDRAIQGVAASWRMQGEPSSGDLVGSYRVVSLIDRGGMGSVYLAERADGEIDQKVAIKLLHTGGAQPGWRERFLKERQLLATLNHPSIVHVVDAGHTGDGRPFLVMEHVEGVPIDRYAAGLTVRERLKLFLRVCQGISHAHRHLIIHRDLKPSNILVDASGQPKVLDFGIAKLQTESGDATQAAEQLLTPNYASPEQLRGQAQSTATDIYSLGAVLYRMLTGASPREGARGGDLRTPSRLNAEVPRDMDFVIGKALRHEPEHRYDSVDEFANDVRAVLQQRPVEARGSDAWYRTGRYLRRYWMPVAAAALVIASLATGAWVADRERRIAERRFADVRQLANKLFDIEYEVRKLPGNTKVRQFVVSTSLDYLRRLAAETHGDAALALEVGTAYIRVARVQGVPIAPNLGQVPQAQENLRIAEGLIRSVLAAQPANATALLRHAQIAHDQMLLARYTGRYGEALALAGQTAERLARVPYARIDKSAYSPLLFAYVNVADQNVRARQFDEALRLVRRAEELGHGLGREDYRGELLWISAEVFRCRGDVEQALKEIDEAVRIQEPPAGSNELWRTGNFILALTNKGMILGEENAISMGLSTRAVECLDRAYRLADGLAHRDPLDELGRSDVAIAGTVMADILGPSDPARALAIYDHLLGHTAEVKDNLRARRLEVKALAGSSYALRRLGRAGEARKRLDTAFQRLNELHLYPAAQVALGTEADWALRALADYEAASGDAKGAVRIYQNLLDKVQVSQPNQQSILTEAVQMSGILRGASAANHRAGFHKRAEALTANDRELWQHWGRELPQSSFVRRQLAISNSEPFPLAVQQAQ